MKIETEVRDAVGGKLIWEKIANNWTEVIEELGWRFIGLSHDGFVLMTKNGYINKFRQRLNDMSKKVCENCKSSLPKYEFVYKNNRYLICNKCRGVE